MGDRLTIKKLFASVLGTAIAPSLTNVDAETARVVQYRLLRHRGLNLNTNTTDATLDSMSTVQLSGNCAVVGFEVVPNVNVTSSGTDYVTVTLWKRDNAGANKNTLAVINTANLTAAALSFVPIVGNLVTSAANNFVLVGGSIGIDCTQAAAGQSGLVGSMINVTLRAD